MNEQNNIIINVQKARDKEIRKEDFTIKLIKAMNRIERILVYLFIICVLAVAIISYFGKKELSDGASDLIISALSFATLGFSIIHNKLSVKQKHIVGYCSILIIYGLVLLIGLIMICFANNLSEMASTISLICLIISGVVESIKVIREVKVGEDEKEKADETKLEKKKNSGLYGKNE